jgi:hypothetical protein
MNGRCMVEMFGAGELLKLEFWTLERRYKVLGCKGYLICRYKNRLDDH